MFALAIVVTLPSAAKAQGKFKTQDLRFAVGSLRLSTGKMQLRTGKMQMRIGAVRFAVNEVRLPVRDMTAPVTKTRKEVRFQLSGDILFDFDKATIRRKAEIMLGRLAEQIKESYPRGKIRIEGHTDSMGSIAYNQKLSERRAASVREWLVKTAGLTRQRITAHGFGEKRPWLPNKTKDGKDDPAGRQTNRRVDIIVGSR